MRVELERIAKLIHEGWMQFQKERGVTFGPNRTELTHPHLVAWEMLDDDGRDGDRFIAAVVLRTWSQRAVASAELPSVIHNAWAEWTELRGQAHPHAKPFHQVHGEDLREHGIQAELIRSYLAECTVGSPTAGPAPTCLALLPFDPHTLDVYDTVLERAIQIAGYQPVRADRLRGSQDIHESVIDQIERASAVVADLTDDNPNVNYEIGVARSLGVPMVMVSEARPPEAVPFYHKGQRIHFYDRDDADWREQLLHDVQASLQSVARTDALSENQRLGLTGFFSIDDHSFEEALIREIKRATRRIVAVGWGLAALTTQRREVMRALREQVLAQPRLIVHILMARKDHPGLVERVREERLHQPNVGIISDWSTDLFTFAMELPGGLSGWPVERVFVRRVRYLPTAMVIMLDDVCFMRCYGPPNTGGWACPWLRCRGSLASGPWSRFLENMVDQAIEHSELDPEMSDRPTPSAAHTSNLGGDQPPRAG